MKLLFLILSVLVQNAGNTFLEQVQKRDSILIADHLRYGVVLENVAEGTPLALPEFKMEGEGESPLVIVKGWQLSWAAPWSSQTFRFSLMPIPLYSRPQTP